jgi:hypothetical protein
MVGRPDFLEGDDTAYAVHVHDEALTPVIKSGCLLYVTKRRDPGNDDLVVLWPKGHQPIMRIFKEMHSRGIKVLKGMVKNEFETYKYDDLDEVAIVAGTRCI